MAAPHGPAVDAAVSVLFLATCAGGGGDVAFALNMAAGLAGRCRLGVLVCQQAHGNGAQALEALRGQTAGLPAAASVALLGAATRLGNDDVRLDAGTGARLNDWLREHGTPPAQLRVLQGPLALWAGAHAAAGWLAQAAPSWAAAAVAAAASSDALRQLLTVREFGMAAFCSPPTGDGRAVDVSSGLGAGELGVFALPRPSPAPLAELLRESAVPDAAAPCGRSDSYFVGYHRADRHAAQLARVVAYGLALRAAEAAVGRQPPLQPLRATVFLPASSRRRFREHLREHPLFAPAGGSGSSSGAAPLATIDGSSDDVLELTATLPPVGSVAAAAGGGGEGNPVAAAPVTLTLVDVFALRLPVPAFRSLLAGADAAVVTGDASLNEALCNGLPCWYAREGHKAGVDAPLRALLAGSGDSVAAVAAAPALVRRWYTHVDGSGHTSGGDSSGGTPAPLPPEQQLADSWAALVGGGDAGLPCPAAFRAAFAAWAAGVLATHGRLVDRVAALLQLPG